MTFCINLFLWGWRIIAENFRDDFKYMDYLWFYINCVHYLVYVMRGTMQETNDMTLILPFGNWEALFTFWKSQYRFRLRSVITISSRDFIWSLHGIIWISDSCIQWSHHSMSEIVIERLLMCVCVYIYIWLYTHSHW